MNSSRLQSRSQEPSESSEMFEQKTSDETQRSMPFGYGDAVPGSFDDTSVIRGVLLDSMKSSGLSRASIAERMSYLLGRSVTDAMLNAFTAESRGDRRWPAEFDRAFCEATGNNTLLTCRVKMANLHVITDDEKDILELGRAFLMRNQADEKIALLQRRLSGRIA